MSTPEDLPLNSGGNYSLDPDEMPIKGSAMTAPNDNPDSEPPLLARGAYTLPDEGLPEEQEKEETGPLEKRIESKTWKTRSKAYEELTLLLKSDTSGPYSDYASSISKYISDSNPGAQEKALELVKVYLLNQPDLLLPHSESLTKSLIEKGMASAKANIKSESLILVLDLFSVHKDNFEGFNSALISMINNKNIKVQSSGLLAVTTLMSSFGVKKVSFKTFVSSVEKHAGASNPQVRGEALNFYKESYKWVRDLIKPAVEKLKKPQQDELQKAFDEIKETQETPSPTRWLRCEESTAKAEALSGPKKPIDIYEMADAKDIFSKYGERWCNSVLEMEKWTEKKTALEEVNKELDYPKLAEKSAGELVAMAKRLINDSNVQVMLQSMRMIGLLAKGQRRYFENYAKQFLPLMLQKFKDKKTQIIQETHQSLDNLMFSLGFEQCLEDFKEALEDKTPSVKTNTCLLIERLAESSPANELKVVAKPIVAVVKKNTDDSLPEVRTASLKLLAGLVGKAPELISPLIKDLPAAKMKKIEELLGKPLVAESKQAPPATAPEPSKAPSKPSKKPSEAKEGEKNSKKDSKDSKPSNPAAQPSSQAKAEKSAEEEASNAISAEEAESIVSSFLPGEMLAQLKDNAWKEKQSGLQKLSEWIFSNQDTVISQNEAILRFVRSTVKDWKENNFNVVKAAIEIFTSISENYNISKRAAASVLNSTAIDKLADGKLVEVYSTCIFSLCGQVTPKFVVALMIKNTAESNKPKVVSETMGLVTRIVQDYGPHSVNLKDVVDYSSTGMTQANPAIKKSSQALLALIYSFLGDKLTPLLSNIKESTMKVLQEEFGRTPANTGKSFKSYKGEVAVKLVDAKKLLEDSMPRANIEKAAVALVKKLTDGNWKVRKEGLDEVEALLDASKMRIQPSGTEALTKALAGRIVDANKSLVRQALLLSAKYAESLGSDVKAVTRQLLPNVILCLGDKQNLLRADAVTALHKWAQEVGVETILSFMAAPLNVENPESRTELLTWMLERKDKLKDIDLKAFIQPALACLQDKSAAIRGKAELFFAEVVEVVKFEAFQPLLKDIKPAVMNSLNPVFDKYRHRGPPVAESSVKPVAKVSKLENLPKMPRVSETPARSTSRDLKDSASPRESLRRSDSTLNKTLKLSSAQSRSSLHSEIAINPTGQKARRLEQEAKCRWQVDEVRKDYSEKLKEQMRSALSNDLFALMFHVDFKKQVEGVSHVSSMLTTNLQDVIEIIDILFKWVWTRLQEATNTQLLKSILELLDLLVNSLISTHYILHDVEAQLLLPILCDKSGQNNVQFKQFIRSIIHKTAKIYQPQKVFTVVLSGTASKNSKSKVECLEALAELIADYGIEVCSAKDLKVIAKQAASSDNNVRNAAVQTMGEVYRCLGDKVWQMVGEVPDKVRTVFEQRFKAVSSSRSQSRLTAGSKVQSSKGQSLMNSFENSRSSTPLVAKEDIDSLARPERSELSHQASPAARPDHLAAKPPPRPEGLRYEVKKASSPSPESQVLMQVSKLARSSTRTVIDIPEEPRFKAGLDLDGAGETPIYDPKAHHDGLFIEELKQDGQSEVDRFIETLRNGDMSSRVDALVAINDIILHSLDKFKEELTRKANNLADALTRVIVITFDKPVQEVPLRFAKYFLTVVNKVCCTKLIIKELNEASLFGLVEQVLTRLLIEDLDKLGENGEGEALLKNLNATMLRILEHCKPTLIFVVLIRLMTKYRSSSASSAAKMPSLIIRCLLKLNKILPSLIRQLEVSKILLAMHEYLLAGGLAGPDDVGLRTVKTLVSELVKLNGADVWTAYDEVRKHSVPDVQIEKWIREMLKMTTYNVTSNLSPKSKASPVAEIFVVLKQDYSKGISQLKEYLQLHPETDYTENLAGLSKEVVDKVKSELQDENMNSNACETPQTGYNLNDFKKRLSMMKERYGINQTQGASEAPHTLETLRNKAKDLLVRQDSRDLNDTAGNKSRIHSFKTK